MDRRQFIKRGSLFIPALLFRPKIVLANFLQMQSAVISHRNSGIACTEQLDLPATKDNIFGQPVGDDSVRQYNAGRFSIGSGFTCTKIELRCQSLTGSPAGNLTGYLYSKTGATAATDTPNALLATSTNTVDASTLSALTYFSFLFSGYAFSADSYWFVIYTDTINASNYASISFDFSDSERVMRSSDASSWNSVEDSAQLYLKLSSGPCS